MIPDIINKIDGLINKKIDKCENKASKEAKKRKQTKVIDIDVDEDDLDDEFYEEEE